MKTTRNPKAQANANGKNPRRPAIVLANAPRSKAQKKQPRLTEPGTVSFAPVARAKKVTSGRPLMNSMKNGDCRIIHREYIGEVVAGAGTPSAFSAATYPVNPGQSGVFPWLSSIAQRFESYRFRRLRFAYETEAPSSLGGSLVLALDYDASDTVVLSKQTAMAFRNSVRSAPWEPCVHSSDQEDLSKLKSHFVRPGAIPPGTDVKLYDVGTLNVCTQNVTTASAVCGELYVEYEIDLLTPIYGNSVFPSGTVSGSTAITSAAMFGTAPISIGSLAPTVSANLVTLTGLVIGQEYCASLFITGTVISVGPSVSITGGTTKVNAGAFPVAATSGFNFLTFVATSSTAVLTYGVTATTVTASDLVVSQIPTSTF